MAGKRFPLWKHKATGLWCRKHKGRFYYFGGDKAKVLERYEREWKYIRDGREPPPVVGGVRVSDACNSFLTDRRAKVTCGELSGSTWAEYFRVCEQLVETLGRDALVDDLRPSDFARLRAAAAARLGPAALAKFVTMVRTVFIHAYKFELVNVPVRYGQSFDKPPRRVMRLERARRGAKLVSASDVWKLLDASDVPMRAMVLLALNCGFGQSDCANLSRRDLTQRPGWIDLVRKKTGTPRRCPLWPETIQAIEAVAAARPEPKDPADSDCVFVTIHGNRWLRHKDRGDAQGGTVIDSVSNAFAKLRRKAGVVLVGGFYTLRHQFRTTADEVKDQPAAMAIMGHADNSMSGYYREVISDERLLAITDHVRRWLLAARPADDNEACTTAAQG